MSNIVVFEVQEGTATAIRSSLAQLGIREPVEVRILWKEPHGAGLLYRILHQPLDITVISKLGQEAGVRWWYHQEGRLNVYIPETEPKAPADLLWARLLEHDPEATLTIEPVREELLNPLEYEVIAHQDQADKDQPAGDSAECIALVIEKPQEWQRDLRLVRGRFLEGVRRYSELWSKKTGRRVTQKRLIEHQASLVSLGVLRVLHSRPSGERWTNFSIYQQYYEPDMVLEFYELTDGKGRQFLGLYAVLGYSQKYTGAGIGSLWRYLLWRFWKV